MIKRVQPDGIRHTLTKRYQFLLRLQSDTMSGIVHFEDDTFTIG